MKQVYHPFNKWEDYNFGMYERTCFMDENELVNDCEVLLSCPEYLYECMTFVSHCWGYSAEHNLSNVNRNRQAWLGQAACCFAHGAPEYITKIAWHRLPVEKQDIANSIADDVINDWCSKYRKRYFEWQR